MSGDYPTSKGDSIYTHVSNLRSMLAREHRWAKAESYDDDDRHANIAALEWAIERCSVETSALRGLKSISYRPDLPLVDLVMTFESMETAQVARARITDLVMPPEEPPGLDLAIARGDEIRQLRRIDQAARAFVDSIGDDDLNRNARYRELCDALFDGRPEETLARRCVCGLAVIPDGELRIEVGPTTHRLAGPCFQTSSVKASGEQS